MPQREWEETNKKTTKLSNIRVEFLHCECLYLKESKVRRTPVVDDPIRSAQWRGVQESRYSSYGLVLAFFVVLNPFTKFNIPHRQFELASDTSSNQQYTHKDELKQN